MKYDSASVPTTALLTLPDIVLQFGTAALEFSVKAMLHWAEAQEKHICEAEKTAAVKKQRTVLTAICEINGEQVISVSLSYS
ncbi:hypothetical protein ACCW76_19460 [Pantoea sp. C8B4]|uniref:hypothetical protein n=1 Tax=Pantoea sp. C8B4 TaxID=3243083 RepID=UPI003ED8AB5F